MLQINNLFPKPNKTNFVSHLNSHLHLKDWQVVIGILAITFLVHSSYINNNFTGLEHGDFESRRAVMPLSQTFEAFTQRFGQTHFYRPLVVVVNSFDAFLFGQWAPGYHLTNLIFYLLVLISVWFFIPLFWKMKRKSRYLVLLILSVHPLSTLIVGSLVMRQEMLLLIFTFATLYSYVQARRIGSYAWTLLTAFCWLLALFSKETAIIIIPALLILWELQSKEETLLNRQVWLSLPITLLFYVYLRMRAVPEIWGESSVVLSLTQRLGTSAGLLIKMIIGLISPIKPSFSDAVAVQEIFTPGVIIAGLGGITILILIWRIGWKHEISKALIITGLFLAPGLNIVPVPRAGSPHYAFLGILGAAILFVLVIQLFKGTIRLGLIAGIALWIIIAGLETYRTGFLFKDDYQLFTAEIEQNPNFREAHYYLGNYYFKQGKHSQAEHEYELALKQQPNVLAFVDEQSLKINYAGVQLAQQKYVQAEQLLQEIYQDNPQNQLVVYNLALVNATQENYQKAIDQLTSTEIRWTQPEPVLLLINSYLKLGQIEAAQQTLESYHILFSQSEINNIQLLIELQTLVP
jgi:tetratricopeptide (TPR) repeat protein